MMPTRGSRRRSFSKTIFSGDQSCTSAATCVPNDEQSKSRMRFTADRPAFSDSQNSRAPSPYGETAPTPVITTLRFIKHLR